MGNYVDSNTVAENAGGVRLSEEKFAQVRDEILKLSFIKKMYCNKQFQRINDFMVHGDTQPAVVYSVNPLIISAYSDEMDGVVFLEFPDELAEMYNLRAGMRLVTSNVYKVGMKVSKDITVGSGYLKRYTDFTPIVQLFLTKDEDYSMKRTELFDEEIWKKVESLTAEYAHSGNKPRNGFFYLTKFNGGSMIFCLCCILVGVGIGILEK